MYNNPFMYGQYVSNFARPAAARGLLSGIKSINWSGILSNTQKTLGIINQTIPIMYQIKPMINNAKTMFKIANTIKNDEPISTSVNNNEEITPIPTNYEETNKPLFF